MANTTLGGGYYGTGYYGSAGGNSNQWWDQPPDPNTDPTGYDAWKKRQAGLSGPVTDPFGYDALKKQQAAPGDGTSASGGYMSGSPKTPPDFLGGLANQPYAPTTLGNGYLAPPAFGGDIHTHMGGAAPPPGASSTPQADWAPFATGDGYAAWLAAKGLTPATPGATTAPAAGAAVNPGTPYTTPSATPGTPGGASGQAAPGATQSTPGVSGAGAVRNLSDPLVKAYYTNSNPGAFWSQAGQILGGGDRNFEQYFTNNFERYMAQYLQSAEQDKNLQLPDWLTGGMAGQIRQQYDLQAPQLRGLDYRFTDKGRYNTGY